MQVAPSLGLGGLERVVSTLSVELSGRGWDVSVHSPGGRPFEHFLRERGVPTLRIPAPLPQPREQLRSALALSRQIRSDRPLLIHAHNPAAAVAARVATYLAGRPGTPVLATYHGVADERLRPAATLFRRAADVVVGCGHDASAELVRAGLPARRVETVLNGIEPSQPADRRRVRRALDVEDVPLVVTVGRYAPEKNQQLLIRAFRHVAEAVPDAQLLVVGSGPLDGELRSLVESLRLVQHVRILGPRDDAVDIVAASDLFVLPSLHEGLPLALLEAMSAARPILATRVRGVAGILDHDVSGRLVPSGAEEQLAAEMISLLRDPVSRARLGGEAARVVASGYSVAAMASGYERLYRRLLA